MRLTPRGRVRPGRAAAAVAAVLLLATVAALGGSALRSALSTGLPLPPARGQGHPPRGAFHVHSNRSDGRGTRAQIAQAARRSGLSFVVVTDHNPSTLEPPAWVDGVLLLEGAELSTPSGHLVALGLQRPLTAQERRKDALGAVRSLGGFSVLAHPVQWKAPWTDWARAGEAAGLERFSADTMLRSALASPFSVLVPAVGAYLANPLKGLYALVGEDAATRDRLLERAAQASFAAFCSVDAHGMPAYEVVFDALAMALPASAGPLPEDPRAASDVVLRALIHGEAYCVFRGWGEGTGFALQGLLPGRTLRPGNVLKVQTPADAPPGTQVRVFGAGTLEADGITVKATGVGALTVEVWAGQGRAARPWLVPSPVRVVPAEQRL